MTSPVDRIRRNIDASISELASFIANLEELELPIRK